MIQQDDLFTAMARSSDPLTSFSAGASVNKRQSQAMVLAALRYIGPVTDERLLDHLATNGLPITPSRARTARHELVLAGLVREAGEGRTRSGRRALLWEAA